MAILRPKIIGANFAKAEKNVVLLEYECNPALFLQNSEMSFLLFGI